MIPSGRLEPQGGRDILLFIFTEPCNELSINSYEKYLIVINVDLKVTQKEQDCVQDRSSKRRR